MGLTITDKIMHSDRTPHTAEPWPVPEHEEPPTLWRVSWLPGQYLERSQAVSAMLIAQVAGDLEPGDRRWPHINGWAAELGLSGPDAVVRASEPSPDPGHTPPRESASGDEQWRLCAHADEDGHGMHYLEVGVRCPRTPPREPKPEAERQARG